MKICFILPTYFSSPIGGYKVVYEHANYLAKAGNRVTIVYPRSVRPPGPAPVAERLKDFVWPCAVQLKQLLRRRRLVSWMELNRNIRLRLVGQLTAAVVPDGDVVIATAWQTALPVSQLPTQKGRQVYLVQDYEVWGKTSAVSVNRTFGLGMRVIAIATWLREVASSYGATDVHVVPNGLDHSRFRVATDPAQRPPSILALFHNDQRKGIEVALAALSSIHQTFPEIPITMFGVPRRDPLLPEWIQYVQLPAPDELVRLYNSHSIFLSSSYAEGWCLPAAEAMACGCAFVGTDSKGPREFCSHGVSALLSEPGQVDDLVENLSQAISNDPLRHKLQESGIASIQRFTWDRAGGSFLRLLNHD